MAQIQIWTRNVDPTNGLLWGTIPQHTFFIKVNDDGTREIIRGGPSGNNMVTGDIEIINVSYNENAPDWYDPTSTSNPLNYQGTTAIAASQSEIDALWNKAWNAAQNINNGHYDYEAFTQNCNTVTSLMANEMGITNEVKSFLSDMDRAHVWTPGFDLDFNHNIFDKIGNLILHPTEPFKEILEFAKNNPTLQTEIGNVSDFTNLLESELESLLNSGQSNLSSAIESLLSLLTQAEATLNPPRVDPLTLDLNHNNQIDLVSLNNSTAFFDLDDDGLRENVGWLNGGVDVDGDGVMDDVNNNGTRLDDMDGFLVLDSNGNNVVDNVNELFGGVDEQGNAVEGTVELATHDTNNDNIINNQDAIFNQLQVWQDFNQNGITDAGELSTLVDHNITSINLNTTLANQNVEGNVILSTGSFVQSSPISGDGVPTTQAQVVSMLANLELAINQTNSSSYTYQDAQGNTISYNLNLDTLTLPFSRGYGNTLAWHIAMSEDGTLLQMMQDIVNLSNGVSYQNLDLKIEEFIYEWTGVSNNGVSSVTGNRGSFDAKKLAALEAIRGVDYQNSENSAVQSWQVNLVQGAWDLLFNDVKTKILMQGTLKHIFDGAYYDFTTDTILGGDGNAVGNVVTGDDSDNAIWSGNNDNIVIAGAGDDNVNGGRGDDTYFYNLGDGKDVIYDGVINFGSVSGSYGNDKIIFGEGISLDDIYFTKNDFAPENGSYQYQDLVIKFKNSPEDQINIFCYFAFAQNKIETLQFADGTTLDISNPDNLSLLFEGTEGSNTIVGGLGNDVINANGGNDIINAGAGNDIINAGVGDDYIYDYNSAGNDTYIYNIGDGKDTINEYNTGNVNASSISNGVDKIKFGEGISREDIYFSTKPYVYSNGQVFNLIIHFYNSSEDQIIIEKHFGSISNQIEFIEFADGTTLDLTNPNNLNFEYEGTGGDDYIVGSAGSDIINSYAGNDTINAGVGNDVIDAGDGNDGVSGQSGNDIINGGNGDDVYLNGEDGNDQIIGGKGDDNINGGKGDDGYFFNLGDGKDKINEYSTSYLDENYGNDKIIFGAGIAQENLTFKYVKNNNNGYDLIIGFNNSANDQITIVNQFYGSANRVETLQFNDGSTLDISNAQNIHGDIFGTAGNDDLLPVDFQVAATINAGAGDDSISDSTKDDIIIGGTGDDYISSYGGNDTYIYNQGDGKDSIAESEGSDRIIFGEGIKRSDIYFEYHSSNPYYQDLIIKFKNHPEDQITLSNFSYPDNKVEILQFANGVTLNLTNDININLTPINTAPTLTNNNSTIFTSKQGVNLNSLTQNQSAVPIIESPDGQTVMPESLAMNRITATVEVQDAKIIFKNSVAGFNSSLGWYKIDELGNISDPQLLFSGAKNIQAGTHFNLGHLEAGTKVGFFIIANGNNVKWQSTSSSNIISAKNNNFDNGTFSFVNQEGQIANIYNDNSPQLIWHNNNNNQDYQITQVNKSASYVYGAIYHSINQTNLNSDNINHSGAGWDSAGNNLLIGFEDLRGGGDKDYNDLLFYLDMGDANENILYANNPSLNINISDDGNNNEGIISNATIELDQNSTRAGDKLVFENSNKYKIDLENHTITFKDSDNDDSNNVNTNISINIANDNQTIILSGNSNSQTYQEIINLIKFVHITQPQEQNDNSSITANINISITDDNNQTATLTQTINITNQPSQAITGTQANDNLLANDYINILSGKEGNDTFTFDNFTDSTINKTDIITDFIQGEDKINLHNLNLLNHSITFDENPNDDQIPEGLSYHFDNDNNTIISNNDNNFSIKLIGQIQLNNGDFEF